MIDPYAAGVTQGGAQHFQERTEPVAHHAARREGREAPILRLRAEQIRRSADRQADQHLVLAAPRMTAAAILPDSEIRDQGDRHAGLACRGLRLSEAAIGEELQEGVEPDFGCVLSRELRYR